MALGLCFASACQPRLINGVLNGGDAGGFDGGEPDAASVSYAPLEQTNAAVLPAGTGSDLHPETLNVVVDPDYSDHEAREELVGWAHGQGYIHASITDVWTALQDLDVVADRRALKSWTEQDTNTEPSAHVSFRAHMVPNSFDVNYDVACRQKATSGTKSAPLEVSVREELTKPVELFGTTIFSTISDSIILTRVDDETTAIATIRHLRVAQPTDPGHYLNDCFASVVARVHGRPLPTY